MCKYCFTTVASCDCLFKLLLMYRTLHYNNKDFILIVLCADDQSYRILTELSLDKMKPVKLGSIEDSQLQQVKHTRSFMEYCWTLKSVILLYAMNSYKNAQYYAHLDSDLCFFSSIDSIFNEEPSSSVFITDHNNSDEFLYTYESSGRFNSGFIGFSNDSISRCVVKWWKDRCLEWCYVDPDIEEKLYGDQRYLELIHKYFHGVHVVRTKGANAAHWNVKKYKVSLKDGEVYLDDDKLIFYHFSGFSIISPDEFNISWLTQVQPDAVEMIYKPYMILLSQEINGIMSKYKDFDRGFIKLDPQACRQYYKLALQMG